MRVPGSYNVTITNLKNETCQLVSRTWLIKTCLSVMSADSNPETLERRIQRGIRSEGERTGH